MAYQMIHLEVAYRLLECLSTTKYQILYPAEFILGAVAPDSVHMRSDYEVEMKVKSHLFENCGPWGDTQDYEQWILNIQNFFASHVVNRMQSIERDFALGKCVHCLTDYCNDLKIWRRLQKENIPPMDLESFREAYYPEARGIDLWLYQNSSNTHKIMELLANAEVFDYEDLVCATDIEKTKNHLLFTQYAVDQIGIADYRFLSASFLEDFLESTVKDIISFLNQ